MLKLSVLIPVCAVLTAAVRPVFNPPPIRQGSFSHQEQAPNPFKVLVWNIDRGTELDRITTAIRELAPQLCLFQEVDFNARRSGRKDVAEALARPLGMNFAFGTAFEELGQGYEDHPAYQGQATLAGMPIESPRVLRFAKQTSFWQPRPYLPSGGLMQRRLGGRIALVTEFKASGKIVAVYNLHLESRGPGFTRYGQLKEVIEDAGRYPATTPVIIAGDLNTKYAPQQFVNQLENAGFRNCFGTQRAKTHHIMFTLDWMFIRGPIRCESARIERQVRASDHYPLTAILRLE